MSFLVKRMFSIDTRGARRRSVVSGWRAWWKQGL